MSQDAVGLLLMMTMMMIPFVFSSYLFLDSAEQQQPDPDLGRARSALKRAVAQPAPEGQNCEGDGGSCGSPCPFFFFSS